MDEVEDERCLDIVSLEDPFDYLDLVLVSVHQHDPRSVPVGVARARGRCSFAPNVTSPARSKLANRPGAMQV
jgi:hypothetical protein